jgi:hypothetical protein
MLHTIPGGHHTCITKKAKLRRTGEQFDNHTLYEYHICVKRTFIQVSALRGQVAQPEAE